MPEEIKNQHKILIEFVFKSSEIFPFFKNKFLIQNKPFYIGLNIKNINEKVFPGAIIKKLTISSNENKNLVQDFKEEFSISILNPGETTKIWIPYQISTFLEGLIWISCNVVLKNSNDEIITYQKDNITGVIDKYNRINDWGDSSYIQSKFGAEQSKTNYLIFVLTSLIFLEGVFGLRNIAIKILWLLKSLFISLVVMIDKII